MNKIENQSKDESSSSQSDQENKSKEQTPGRPKQESTLNIHNAFLTKFPDIAIFQQNWQSYTFNEQSARKESNLVFKPLHKSNQRKGTKDIRAVAQLKDENRQEQLRQMSPRKIAVKQGVQMLKKEEEEEEYRQEIKHITSNFQFVDRDTLLGLFQLSHLKDQITVLKITIKIRVIYSE